MNLDANLTLKAILKVVPGISIWDPLVNWLCEHSFGPDDVEEEEDFIAWHLIYGENPVWFDIREQTLLVSAKTKSGGPGYHAWLCDAFRSLEIDLEIEWLDVYDSTGFWSSGDEDDLRKLNDKPLFDMSDGHAYPHKIWPEIGVSASVFVEQAKALMHSLSWAPPLTDHGRDMMESIDRLLNRARAMDSNVEVPAREWVEVKALLDQECDIELAIEAAEQSGVLIGYKREPFSYIVEGKLFCSVDANTQILQKSQGEELLVSENGSIRIRMFKEGAEDYPVGVLPGKQIAVPFTLGFGIGAIESVGKRLTLRTISVCGKHVIKTEITSDIPEAEAWCLEKLEGMSFGLGPHFPMD